MLGQDQHVLKKKKKKKRRINIYFVSEEYWNALHYLMNMPDKSKLITREI